MPLISGVIFRLLRTGEILLVSGFRSNSIWRDVMHERTHRAIRLWVPVLAMLQFAESLFMPLQCGLTNPMT
jgi:hypothetical protein